jgi:peroxiredoxin
MDSFASNKRFAEDIGVKFPLLSDWKREVVKSYGVYDERSGYGMRATFVVDKEGRIRYVEEGRTAIDPTGAYQACSIFAKPTKTER